MNENQALKAELALFQARCEQYSQAYDSLKEQIREMQRHRFGQRSERYIDPAQTQLDFLQDNNAIFSSAEALGDQLPEETSQVAAHTRKKRIKPKRIYLVGLKLFHCLMRTNNALVVHARLLFAMKQKSQFTTSLV